MSITNNIEPLVTVSHDEMEAYIYLPTPQLDHTYTLEEIESILASNGVQKGILTDRIEEAIKRKMYMKDVLVAKGKNATDGEDGYFEYNFRTELSGKPMVKQDGSVDYWNLDLIEVVNEGQTIAVYHPAVQGEDGYTVNGKVLPTTKAREQQPLKGKGFTRSEDNLIYTANITGKIELKNGHVNISPVYEIFGNVGLESGNIDFKGDVQVHGNVESGFEVKATGTITIDGLVESANIYAEKDIVLRGGVMGNRKADIRAGGNINAKFFEYANVDGGQDINAEVFIGSDVRCRGSVVLKGKKGSIIGGYVRAIKGIECKQIGNDSEIPTEVCVGVGMDMLRNQQFYHQKIAKYQEQLSKIQVASEKIEQAQKAGVKIDMQKKMELLRVKIKIESDMANDTSECNKIDAMIEDGARSTIKVIGDVYPRTKIVIGEAHHQVTDSFRTIEFVKRMGKIIMQDIS